MTTERMGWLRRRNFFFLFIPQFQDRRLSVACNCCVAQKFLSEALWCWMLHLCHTAPSVGSFLSITLFGNTLFIHVAILVGQLYRNSQHLGIWLGIFYTMTYQCSQDTWRTTKTSGSPQKDPRHLTWTQIRALDTADNHHSHSAITSPWWSYDLHSIIKQNRNLTSSASS